MIHRQLHHVAPVAAARSEHPQTSRGRQLAPPGDAVPRGPRYPRPQVEAKRPLVSRDRLDVPDREMLLAYPGWPYGLPTSPFPDAKALDALAALLRLELIAGRRRHAGHPFQGVHPFLPRD